jgi:hypothetical protein
MRLTSNRINYDLAAIEAALERLGATYAEADALTEILHEEGWGGIEETCNRGGVDIDDATLRGRLEWYREERA